MRPLPRRPRWVVLVAMSLVVLGIPRTSSACPVDDLVGPTDGPASTVPPSTRLAFIRERMDVGTRRALAWNITWGLLYGAASVTQLSIAPTLSSGRRYDLWVGGISASIGTMARIVNVPAVIRERRRLRRYLRGNPDPCAAVREAERALARSAKWEARSTHLALHFGALAFSVGAGLVLAVAFDRPIPGHRQMAIGGAVGQLMLITTPTTTLRALGTYQRGDLRPHATRRTHWQTVPMFIPGGAGVAFAGTL
jgi:hypothetical protein